MRAYIEPLCLSESRLTARMNEKDNRRVGLIGLIV